VTWWVTGELASITSANGLIRKFMLTYLVLGNHSHVRLVTAVALLVAAEHVRGFSLHSHRHVNPCIGSYVGVR
jgi:hypothetical protein